MCPSRELFAPGQSQCLPPPCSFDRVHLAGISKSNRVETPSPRFALIRDDSASLGKRLFPGDVFTLDLTSDEREREREDLS